MAAITQTGAPRDKDKLIRQLSLVAYLMAKQGRPVKAEEIRRYVEGYDDGTRSLDTFTRRFYADRDGLAHLGIEIESSRDEAGEGDTYWLPPENFFLPTVPFSREELAALHTCLFLLEGQFAYGHLLRLALQSLALGTGNALEDPVTDSIAVDMASSGLDAEVAGRQRRIDEAVASHKTIRFDYHNFSNDTVEERLVDPYRMMYTLGDWYLVGYSRERGAVRIFKLRRIRGRITYLDKKDHDFEIPTGFRAEDYVNLKPWQLGPVSGVAEIRFSPRFAWWARNNYAGCGEFENDKDGAAILRTQYADGRQICSQVLARSDGASITGPPELRKQMVSILEGIAREHQGPAQALPATAPQQPERHAGTAGAHDPHPQVEPERFSQLAKTVAYLESRLDGEEFVTLPVTEVCHDLGLDRNQLQQTMGMLYIVSAESGGYLVNGTLDGDSLQVEGFPHGELLRQPLRLTPREARAMLLALDLVGGQILAGRNQSLQTAREKIIQAAGGLDDLETIPIGKTGNEDFDICRAVNRGLAEHRLVEIEYLSESRSRIESRIIEPYLVNGTKGRWYLVAWCRKRGGIRTFRFEMVKSARLLDETFEPRAIDLDPFRNDPRLPSGTEAPGQATVLFSPDVSRWVYEKQPGTVMLEDGSLLAEIPWFDRDWIVHEILRYCGDAVVFASEKLRQQVADAAMQLSEKYR